MDDFNDLPTDELEAQLARAVAQTSAEEGWALWLRAARVSPGRFPGLPTAPAYVLYRAWCALSNVVVLRPFDFARLMLTRFRKVKARVDGRVTTAYALSLPSAERLRAASRLEPATAADHALFSFAELRRVSHPKDPSAPAQADAPAQANPES